MFSGWIHTHANASGIGSRGAWQGIFLDFTGGGAPSHREQGQGDPSVSVPSAPFPLPLVTPSCRTQPPQGGRLIADVWPAGSCPPRAECEDSGPGRRAGP